ncbi:trigger factor [Spirochaeta isovalerica]|uniref:Trigger factor n=1 Tax=Spirochaeta isovalerica TaxID=150 RepID=A0A841RFB4_9SPIO|nr:trigger factor [Spirochaeta isovalerica]
MIVKKSVEKLENSSVKLSITVKGDEAKKEYNELLTKYGKEAQIKGFRKGKVPASVLERKFGEGIRGEAAGNIMDKSLREAFETVEEKPLGYTHPEVVGDPELKIGEDFSFEVKYDVFPEFELKDYKGLELKETQVSVTKADEEAELKAIQEQNSVVMDKKDGKVADDSIVTVDYCELDDEKNEVEGKKREDFVFTVGTGYNYYKIDEEIKGMKKDEEKVIEKEYPEDFEAQDLAGRKVAVKVLVKAVKEKILPELDDELAQDVDEKYETLDDLKKALKKQCKDRAKEKVDAELRTQAVDKLVEATEIDVPKSMVDVELEQSWRNFVQQSRMQEEQLLGFLEMQGQTKEQLLDTWRADAEKSVKGQLIIGKILEEEKVEISDEEFEEELQKQADMYNMPIEDLKKSFGENNLTEYLKSDMKTRKVYDMLIKEANIVKGEKVKYADYIKG